MNTLNFSRYIFFSIVIVGLISILFTYPFLHYPYDEIAHLIAIDEMYHGATITTTTIQHERLIWHRLWARIFHIFHVGSYEMFSRAQIIHIIQTYIALFSVYYYSNVIIRNIFKNISVIVTAYLSLFSTIIWFTIFATYSVAYQQVWNMWYSVNYQITLPLFWYITALTLVVILEKTSKIKKFFFIFQISILSFFMIRVHVMEFLYYLMTMGVFFLIYSKAQFGLKIKHYIFGSVGVIVLIYVIQLFQLEKSQLFIYFDYEKFPLLYDKLMRLGALLIGKYNRSEYAINELMYFIFWVTMFSCLHIVLFYEKSKKILNLKMLIFIILTASFIFIPLNQFMGGLFSLITRLGVVNRFYYSSSLFVLLPIFFYYWSRFYKFKTIYVYIGIILVLLGVYFYSKFMNDNTKNYYKNIQSIQNSFYKKRVGFHLSSKDILRIGQILVKYEKKNTTTKKLCYFARADIAFVIKFIYHKKVYWKGRRKNPDYLLAYNKHKKNLNCNPILFKLPQGFPKYVPYR